ncbi:Toxic cation resistance protein OS=Streptomyces glaucescens OX=1907 GN=SGLAU_09160 PE=4 SV=1 [Streptomyces glaucescens]
MAAISLDKVRETAPALVNLYKSAGVSLVKHGLEGQRAAVYLVVDHSGSMRPYYRDGSVQALADRVLGLSAHLDDDGRVPVVFFSTGIDTVTDIALAGHRGRIERIAAGLGHMGRTSYHLAMDAVIDHYLDSGATPPRPGRHPDRRRSGRQGRRRAVPVQGVPAAAVLAVHRFGDPDSLEFDFLRRLDELPVPGRRMWI